MMTQYLVLWYNLDSQLVEQWTEKKWIPLKKLKIYYAWMTKMVSSYITTFTIFQVPICYRVMSQQTFLIEPAVCRQVLT